MPYRRPNKYTIGAGTVVGTGRELGFRDPTVVETIVGKRRKAMQIGTGFFEWPLWTAFPTWHQVQGKLRNKN